MPKTVLMDEFHLKVFVPTNLTPRKSQAIRRVINSRRFRVQLVRTIRKFFSHYPSLDRVTVKVSA